MLDLFERRGVVFYLGIQLVRFHFFSLAGFRRRRDCTAVYISARLYAEWRRIAFLVFFNIFITAFIVDRYNNGA